MVGEAVREAVGQGVEADNNYWVCDIIFLIWQHETSGTRAAFGVGDATDAGCAARRPTLEGCSANIQMFALWITFQVQLVEIIRRFAFIREKKSRTLTLKEKSANRDSKETRISPILSRLSYGKSGL